MNEIENTQQAKQAAMEHGADLSPDAPLEDDVCDHCMRCVEACTVKALSGGGKINKKLWGDHIFEYGFRYFQKVMQGMMDKTTGKLREIVQGSGLRQLWQTFMTGNYYCFKCQSQCPSTRLPAG
jgi:epoxyqueuosine reductase QueG